VVIFEIQKEILALADYSDIAVIGSSDRFLSRLCCSPFHLYIVLMKKTDFLIIGAGVIGLQCALKLKRKYPKSSVLIIEKENEIGYHASGRNSGVLHAGFYYSEDSLKAKFTSKGNEALTNYCERNGLRINKCGKLVVARNEADLQQLSVLFMRGKKNKIKISEVSEKEAKRLEPRVRTFQKALWSPLTSSIDPIEVINSFLKDAILGGITFRRSTPFKKLKGKTVVTGSGEIEAGFIINAAGLYADMVANEFGLAQNYRILPLKGLYLKSIEAAGSLSRHIYPVPDLNKPFLGVHHTVSVDGKSKIGPTAIPAFWREHYNGSTRFSISEMAGILKDEVSLFLNSGFDFKNLALEEIRKYRKANIVKQAAELCEGTQKENYKKWGKPGIRAQLFNIKEKTLEMDFVVERGENSLHILNAVSPAFTCSIPFAEYVVNQIK